MVSHARTVAALFAVVAAAGLTTSPERSRADEPPREEGIFLTVPNPITSEGTSLLNDRLLLSGGYSRFFGQLSRVDSTGIPPANTYPTYDLTTDAKTLGVVVKVVKGISLFYGYNTSGGTMPSSLNPGTYPPNFRAACGPSAVTTLPALTTSFFTYFAPPFFISSSDSGVL